MSVPGGVPDASSPACRTGRAGTAGPVPRVTMPAEPGLCRACRGLARPEAPRSRLPDGSRPASTSRPCGSGSRRAKITVGRRCASSLIRRSPTRPRKARATRWSRAGSGAASALRRLMATRPGLTVRDTQPKPKCRSSRRWWRVNAEARARARARVAPRTEVAQRGRGAGAARRRAGHHALAGRPGAIAIDGVRLTTGWWRGTGCRLPQLVTARAPRVPGNVTGPPVVPPARSDRSGSGAGVIGYRVGRAGRPRGASCPSCRWRPPRRAGQGCGSCRHGTADRASPRAAGRAAQRAGLACRARARHAGSVPAGAGPAGSAGCRPHSPTLCNQQRCCAGLCR